MQDSFDIYAARRKYTVRIEPGAFPRFVADNVTNAMAIADQFFEHSPVLSTSPLRRVFYFPGTESSKSLAAVPALIEQLRDCGANRQTQLLAIGGGAIQDLTSFAASIYMRGVPWTYIPTTILSMVDSCIGGKSAINVGSHKNLVGTYHPPAEVWIDPELAATLPREQQVSGLIEAAKICFCRGPECFDDYLACEPRPGMDACALATVITTSLRAKKWFIETDEFDRKERLRLNFGHTFGHAIEGASHYAISHGIAVGLGMLCALAFVRSEDRRELVGTEQLEEHLHTLLHAVPDLGVAVGALCLNTVMERFQSDKKHAQESYVLVLVARGGRVTLRALEKNSVTLARCRAAIESVVGAYAGVPFTGDAVPGVPVR